MEFLAGLLWTPPELLGLRAKNERHTRPGTDAPALPEESFPEDPEPGSKCVLRRAGGARKERQLSPKSGGFIRGKRSQQSYRGGVWGCGGSGRSGSGRAREGDMV